jgi:hypothetical protein
MGYLKRFAVGFAIATFGAFAGAAKAVPIDVSTFTCKDLLAAASAAEAEQANVGVMLWWVLGYASTDSHGTVMDFDNLDKGMGQIEEYCTRNPGFGLLTAAHKFGGDNAPEPTPAAVDVSTVKCEAALSSGDDRIWGSVPWLAGYFASYDEDSTFDLEAITRLTEGMAAFCATNPQSGLVTAYKSVTASDG